MSALAGSLGLSSTFASSKPSSWDAEVFRLEATGVLCRADARHWIPNQVWDDAKSEDCSHETRKLYDTTGSISPFVMPAKAGIQLKSFV